MLTEHLWEALHYQVWAERLVNSNADGIDMILKNLASGKECFPRANVHLPWAALSRFWNGMTESERDEEIKMAREQYDAHFDDLRAAVFAGDRSRFSEILTTEAPEDEPPVTVDKTTATKRRKKKKEVAADAD